MSLPPLGPDGVVPFEALERADLVLERRYAGGARGNSADDPLGRLLPVGNQGGFRFRGSVARDDVRLVVLYTSGLNPDWPDELNPESGDFTYFGDNRSPGRQLHETSRGGNTLLRAMFAKAHGSPEDRRRVPPILLFEKTGVGRGVRFRGLLAPGSSRLTEGEELVAVWRTKTGHRFQNYRAHFTVLNTPVVSRVWLDEVLDGEPLGSSCPPAWRHWVQGRIYDALEAPRTVRVRSTEEQYPGAGGRERLDLVYRHFKDRPHAFEYFAADLWQASDPNVGTIDVTRASRDGGRDAVGLYAVGPTSDPIKITFALEAKCWAPGRGVGVKPIARLISRIRHRDFGVFVTTSHIDKQAYEEVRVDQHPIIFITGADIVQFLGARGLRTVPEVQGHLDARYPGAAGPADDLPDEQYEQPPIDELAPPFPVELSASRATSVQTS